jgi:protein-histidine pros-kinase
MINPNTTELIEQDNKGRVIPDRSRDAFVEIDSNNIIVDWNNRAEIVFGWTREQVIGKTFAEVVIPTRYRKAQNKELKYFHKQVKFESPSSNKQIEIFVLRSDGQEFPAEMTVFPVASGNSVNLGAFIRHSREWEVADHNFRRLLELAPDAMMVVNQLGNIVLVNSQTEHIFGYKREEILGQAVEKLIPDHSKFLDQCHKRSVNTGLELYALRKDGTEFPVEISLSPLETELGLLVSSVIRDITERKHCEQDLKKQKELFQIILNSLADGVIVADHLGRF